MLVVAGRRVTAARRSAHGDDVRRRERASDETPPRAPPAVLRERMAHARPEVGPEVRGGGNMAGYGVANERLRALEELEREIGAALQSAGGRGLAVGGA